MVGKVSKQCTRLRKLISIMSKPVLSDDHYNECKTTFTDIISNLSGMDFDYDHAVLSMPFEHTPRVTIKLKVLLQAVQKHLDKLIREDKKRIKEARNRELLDDKYLRSTYRYLTKKNMQPLSVLKTASGANKSSTVEATKIQKKGLARRNKKWWRPDRNKSRHY